ncbi:MAG: THUMP domain-containing protein [Myxococcota bacterium]|nr:THUMP domain-containing protein [Myxococcota bacterium]
MNAAKTRRDPLGHFRPLFATCDAGFEAILAKELKALGAERVSPMHRGVGLFGDREVLWRANLESRIANRILCPVAEFPAADREALYEAVKRVHWPAWFTVEHTIALDASSHKSALTHTAFIAQVAKDAVCDVFRDAYGRRPSVDKHRPDVRINLRLDSDRCILSLDSSGARLHRRGYRMRAGTAPVKETIAAGILKRLGYHANVVLYDPMCGSGTFLIEAALMASNTPPGLLRVGGEGFGFMRWLTHKKEAFQAYLRRLEDAILPLEKGRFFGSDVDGAMIDMAEHNSRCIGLSDAFTWRRLDVADVQASPEASAPYVFVVCNPPYGARMGEIETLDALYPDLGRTLKVNFSGARCGVLLGDDAPHRAIGLRANRKTAMRNGAIPCHLFEYEIFPRTNRA